MAKFADNFFSIAYSLIPLIFVGIYGYRVLNAFYKIFLLQALMTAVMYAKFATDFTAGNHFMFNGYITLDFTLIMAAAATAMKRRTERKWILVGFLLFIAAYIVNLAFNGTEELANYAIAASAIPVLVIYLTLLYRSAQDKSTRPMTWLCVGLVLYFCCCAPFLGLFNYIQKNHKELSEPLQRYIIEPLGHLRYFLTALSFWLYIRGTRNSPLTESVWPKAR